ncbi:hypothetical protein COT98_00735 [Candidatus Falkowbacteria bacterium CG10_big_fil_rev_8_21_14_0_10_39_9]|uniref:Uncharacterized protein n=1 Tax=Candidatus Falkowbacteria bacterium CG10_big_fil_rev_8_21_14_0_10_39_9 TaxID=1974566 RepID=A0A2M6WQX4_9BACT|nr:MAG: hypothetical protein COT98_00735 [Candidatus Falkowbacteria bacterium CG10_big_fil_rev_8_21_14_0_10_39_9]
MFGKKDEKLDDAKKLSQDKSNKLEETLAQNIVVHKMPKNYKAGTFSYNDYFNRNAAISGAKGNSSTVPRVKGKKTGIIIMLTGAVVLGLLVYGAFVYLKTPEKLSFLSFLQPKTAVPVVTKPAVTVPVVVPTSTFSLTTTTEEAVTTTVAITTPTSTSILTPVTATDTDADGLSDAEEALLGTDANAADSDGDQYNDLTELVGLYNPAGNGKLVDNVNIKKYVNAGKYNLLYPKNWKLDLVDKGASVIFTAVDLSFIQAITQVNDKKLTAKAWYEAEFGSPVLDSQVVKYNNWEGVKSVDGLITYLADQNAKNIYIISYTPVSDKVLSYINIFEAMIRSFTVEK